MSLELTIRDALANVQFDKPAIANYGRIAVLLRAPKQSDCGTYNEFAAVCGPLMTSLSGCAVPIADK